MKIVITNAYTWGNKGDAGILLGTIDTLLDIYGENLEVDILTFSPELDKTHYLGMKGIHGVYENVLSPYKPNPLHIPVQYLNVIRGTFQRLTMLLNEENLNTENYMAIRNAGYVIACGGGYLGGNNWAGNYLHLFLIDTCIKLNKKVVMVGNSIEPSTNKYVIRRLHQSLLRLEAIFARENITYSFLTENLGLDNVKLIPDMAFMLKPSKKIFNIRKKCGIESNQLLIGITVRKCSNIQNEITRYITIISDTMTNVIRKKNAHFVFIPQVRFLDDDDLKIAQHIKDHLNESIKNRFTLISDDYSPSELKTLIGECDVFFGTRMHSVIFATSMRIPSVAIAYQEKTNGIMRMLGLSDYVLNISELDVSDCYHKIEKCLNNKDSIATHLDHIIPKIQDEITLKVENFLSQL